MNASLGLLTISLNSLQKFSQLRISNQTSITFISLFTVDALNSGTHEEEVEPILLTNFQQSPKSVLHPVGCFFVIFVSFLLFFDLLAKQT